MSPTDRTPRWALMSAIAAPLTLPTAATAAGILCASTYDPIRQTMSVLAATGRGASVMTAGFVIAAGCQILTAAGLCLLAPMSRIVVAIAGCCGLTVAALPVSLHEYPTAHLLAAGLGTAILSIWPLMAMSNSITASAACRRRWAMSATFVFAALLAWVLYETRQGTVLGLAERIAVAGEMFWPLAVAATTTRPRFAMSRRTSGRVRRHLTSHDVSPRDQRVSTATGRSPNEIAHQQGAGS